MNKVWALLLVGLLLGLACNRRTDDAPGQDGAPDPDLQGPDLFQVVKDSGVDFTYRNGEDLDPPHLSILESLGGGLALIDYDGDGLLDIFLVGGGYFAGPDHKQIRGHPCKLYKNLGNFKFRDVTKEVGLDGLAGGQPWFYSHAAAVGDYDRDGWPDLLVTGWGRIALFRNVPDGKGGRRFVDVSADVGLDKGITWATSAAWADLDGDGFPDLYVCQYVNWSFDNNPLCAGYTSSVPRDVCPPKTFTGLPHKLYRNNGNGTFSEVSRTAKLRPTSGDPEMDKEAGKGLGVVIVDVDGDGKPDIYVANDTVDNFLYLNHSTPGKLLFEDTGLATGVARDDRGIPNGSMGTDADDYDGSGRPSIWVTNYENEMHALYRNQGAGIFLFSTASSGIAAIGQKFVGFGTAFIDIDNHGWDDIVVANGHVIRHPAATGLRQRPVLLRNLGAGRFVDITRQGGEYFRSDHIGRGLAIGDLDNDGRLDVVVSHVNEPAVVLRNEADRHNHWVGIELKGRDHRDFVGAKVVVEAGGRKFTHFAKGGGSYCSSPDRRLVFGLGDAKSIERITVAWPLGQTQEWSGKAVEIDRYWRLTEGKNEAEALYASSKPES